MYNQGIVQEYRPSVVGSKPRPEDAMANMNSAINVALGRNGDTLQGQSLRQYASKLTVYDSYARRFKNYTYNYLDNFGDETHVTAGTDTNKDEFPLISATPTCIAVDICASNGRG